MNRKGMSLLEIVVALAVVLIVTAVVAALLLKHVDRSHVAEATSDVVSLRDALHSSLVREDIADENGDGDLIDDLVKRGYLDNRPKSIPGASWTLKAIKVGDVSVFYVEITCSTDLCRERVADLDENLDGGDGQNAGLVQWS